MTKEQKLEIVKLRQEKKTYAQIGTIMGVSRQRIHQILSDTTTKRNLSRGKNWVYPAFTRYVRETDTTIREMSNMLGVTHHTFRSWMVGDRDIKLEHIKKILAITGMTFEEAFQRKDSSAHS